MTDVYVFHVMLPLCLLPLVRSCPHYVSFLLPISPPVMTNLVALPDLAVITAWCDKKKKKKEETLVTHVWEEKESAHVAKKKKDVWNTLTKNQEYLYWLGFVNKVSESNHCVINHHDLTCWSLTHLCPRDFWCPPAGLEPFEPTPSVSPLSSPSPSGPSSSLPELSSPQLLWPEDTNRILIWSVSGLKSFLPDATSFVVLFSSGRQKVQYLSVCNVEGLGQLGEVLIDVNCLQAPAVSGQTFVEWNGVALRRTHHTTKRNLDRDRNSSRTALLNTTDKTVLTLRLFYLGIFPVRDAWRNLPLLLLLYCHLKRTEHKKTFNNSVRRAKVKNLSQN